MQWWVARNGQQSGPLEHSDLIQKAARGELLPTDLLWRVGLPAWTPAGQIPGLLTPPPLPQSASNMTPPQVPRTIPPPLPGVIAQSGGPAGPSIRFTGSGPNLPVGEATPGRDRTYQRGNESKNWYFEALRKYAVFRGRARRKEFWIFNLVSFLVAFVLGSIDGFAGLASDHLMGPLGGLYVLATLLPSAAVAVRRLQDTGRSGWWLLVGAVPLLGLIVLWVFWAEDSQPGYNKYGPNPKAFATG